MKTEVDWTLTLFLVKLKKLKVAVMWNQSCQFIDAICVKIPASAL